MTRPEGEPAEGVGTIGSNFTKSLKLAKQLEEEAKKKRAEEEKTKARGKERQG